MKAVKRDPACQECDEDGFIEKDCTATFIAVRYKCECMEPDEDEMCGDCWGSGEGRFSDSTCAKCKGSGVKK